MILQEKARLENEEALLWICENQNLIERYYDDFLLETIQIEQFDRLYGHLLQEIYPEYKLNYEARRELDESIHRVLKESWLDLGVDAAIIAGSFLPGAGSAVAGVGAFYYLVKAYIAFDKGQMFDASMNMLSAIFTSVQLFPAAGTALGTAGKTAVAAIREAFAAFFSSAGKILGMGAKEAVAGEKALAAASKESGMLMKGAKTVIGGAGKLLDRFLGYIKTGGEAVGEVLSKASKGKVTLDGAIKLLDKFKTKLGLITEAVVAKEGPEATRAMIKVGEEFGEITAKQADELLKLSGTGKAIQVASKDLMYFASNPQLQQNIAKGMMPSVEKIFAKIPGVADDFAKQTGMKLASTSGGTTKLIFSQGGKPVIRNLANPAHADEIGKFLANSKVFQGYMSALSKAVTQSASKAGVEITEEAVKATIKKPGIFNSVVEAFMRKAAGSRVYGSAVESEKLVELLIGKIVAGLGGMTASQIETAYAEDREARIDKARAAGRTNINPQDIRI